MKDYLYRNQIKLCVAAILLTVITLIAVQPVLADEGYRVTLDGQEYDGEAFTLHDIAYVSLREFACAVDNSIVSWDSDSMTATVETDSLVLHAADGENYISANGRVLWCEEGVFTDNGIIYVPLQQAAQSFGFSAYYDSEEHTTRLTRQRGAIIPADEYYDEEELYWLSQIIHAESQGEPFLGKIAVGSVILNRVDSDEFPDTIHDVIFDNENGVQFTPTANGQIEKPAGEESVLAAKICLEDTRISDEILYFLNESIATNFWIVENCRYVLTIGDHDFYAP